MPFMTRKEVRSWQAYAEPPLLAKQRETLHRRLAQCGQWTPNQIAGRRWGIGCVSLEVTQRCNLDCTLCYLSEHAEAVHDIPLEEIYRRIDMIHEHYGRDTDIQISGGDPTLRRQQDLLAITERIVSKGMRASLFTNGILATRARLAELARAGLSDVAFHVDMTQKRKGYHSESDLNRVREAYLERVRGLPLAVFFNTTVCADNFHEIPGIVRFFRRHAGQVRVASFQLQADSGRGVLRERAATITQRSVIEQINAGAGTLLNFDTFAVGHTSCNKYAMAYAINGTLCDAYDAPELVVPLMRATAGETFPRHDRRVAARAVLRAFAKSPRLWWRGARYLAGKLWLARRDLWQARGRVDKLTFVVHNFMDACKLEADRVQACVFMVATGEGPLSMCMHNAKRDEYILRPVQLGEGAIWQPLTGVVHSPGQQAVPVAALQISLKRLRGRARQRALALRPAEYTMASQPEVSA
jgi:7,8-dihydro-6-hydroxymethylpterin dimethyltransferase